MRIHIWLDDALATELDRRAGKGNRSAFVAELIRRALDEEYRWDEIEASLGSLADQGHDWDDDPARWVAAERAADRTRSG